jgi:hypothetical protein
VQELHRQARVSRLWVDGTSTAQQGFPLAGIKRTLGLNIFLNTAVKYGYRSLQFMDAGVLPKNDVVPDEAVSESRQAVATPALNPPNEAVRSLARFAASSGSLASDAFGSSGVEKGISRPNCLLSGALRKGDGTGPVVPLGEHRSKLLVITLGISDVVERTGLTVSVWGSPDQQQWGDKPLLTFRQRQYCGVYSVLLNMAMHTDVRYLRVQWSMNLWGRGERIPMFGFEVFLEESGARVSGSAVA